MAMIKDLTWQRFGKLVVIKRVKNYKNSNDRHCYWLCKCDCGNQVSIVGTSLTNGMTKSCGCLRKDKIIDLTGQRFGKLTVIRKDEKQKRTSDRSCLWLCKCDCGNEIIVKSSNLKNGYTKSCGCLRKEKYKNLDDLYKSRKIETKYNYYDLSGECGIGYTHNREKFYFDLEDYNKIKDYCWCMDKNKYVNNSRFGIRMHRLVMNCNDNNLVVDHINHITYDNRKENLRICTLSQNGMNKSKQSNNTSGHIGITYDSSTNKWRARLGVGNKTINIGRFENLEDAIKARKEAEEKYFGEYSYDNSIKISNDGEYL